MTQSIAALLLGFWLLECGDGNGSMNVYYYDGGNRSQVHLQSSDATAVRKALFRLVEESDDRLSVYVGKAMREQITTSDTVVEVVLSSTVSLNSSVLGTHRVRRVLLPITGYLGGNDRDPGAIFLIGDEEYLSTPLGNSRGRPLVREIFRIVEGARDQ